MIKNVLRVRYRGREVNIVSGICHPENGYLFKLAYDSGMPVVTDQKDCSQPGFISAWTCVFKNQDSADEIFRRMFGLTADDALEHELARSEENIALVILTSD